MLPLLWAVALNPLVNLSAVVGGLWWGYRQDFFVASVAVVTVAVLYIVLGPRVKRNRAAWSSAPRGAKTGTGSLAASSGQAFGSMQTPLLFVVHGVPGLTSVQHALYALRAPEFDTAVTCVPPSRLFRLPLSRIALSSLGGLMPYTRKLLGKLLRRHAAGAKSASHTVLLYPTPLTRNGAAAGEYAVTLDKKGAFSTALAVGATVLPCVSTGDGRLHVGKPVGGEHPTETPMPQDVTGLARAYAESLRAVAAEKASMTLTVQE